MQSKQLFEWFLQQQGETPQSIAGIMSRANQVIDLHRADSRYDELSDAELSETFFSDAILFFVHRNLEIMSLPAGASSEYALKVWAQENNICNDMPDAVREALSPDEQLDYEQMADEQMARETAEIVAYLVYNGATEVIITTKMTPNGRIVGIMADQPLDLDEDPDDEFDLWVFLELYPDDKD